MSGRSAILLLAAGSSRRMGDRDKQLLPWKDGQSLLRHCILQATGSSADSVYVVLGHHYECLSRHVADLTVGLLHHPDHAQGLGSSLASGTRQLLQRESPDRLLVMLADQPGVTAALIEAYFAEGDRYPACAVATDYGGCPGVPALFPATYFAKLTALTGDSGAGKLLREPGQDVRLVHALQLLFDIDTAEDYHRWRPEA